MRLLDVLEFSYSQDSTVAIKHYGSISGTTKHLADWPPGLFSMFTCTQHMLLTTIGLGGGYSFILGFLDLIL